MKRSDFTKKVYATLTQTGMSVGALSHRAGYSRRHVTSVIRGYDKSPRARQRILDALEGKHNSLFISKPNKTIVYKASFDDPERMPKGISQVQVAVFGDGEVQIANRDGSHWRRPASCHIEDLSKVLSKINKTDFIKRN